MKNTFTLAHVGVNTENAEEALALAELLSGMFNLAPRHGQKSEFAGPCFECMKAPFHGKNGHIAMQTPDLESAVAELREKGFSFRDETAAHDDAGKLKNIYLAGEYGGFAIHILPARHFSGRSLTRNKTLWAGFALVTPERRIFFSGDSGYGKHFAEIGARFGGFDLAMLDCGQYDENWRYVHMMPEDTAQAAEDLRARALLPGHAGKFIFGHLDGVPVVCMQGRIHYYEGYELSDVVLPARLMHLLGAEVLFHKIMAIGIPGIFVAWVVTPVVLISTYIFGQKVLKMPSQTLNIVISADMSVCGTSAAIATAAAARAKKEELTLSIGLSLTFTAIMMVVMPAFIKAVGMPEILGGAWIGGTVDATGAVAAAGAFIGPKALQVAATVKMIQNVLIGVTAFCVAIYFSTKVEARAGESVGAMEIWHRFPKFVIGFLAVSVIFSLVSSGLGADFGKMLVDNGTNKISVPLRGWFFGLAFVAIGLTTNFRELGKYFKGGKPIILYVCGQSLNLALTLLMAWIMFYKVFPEITAKI